MLTDHEDVRQVFTGDPAPPARRRGERAPAVAAGRRARCCCWMTRDHIAPAAAAAATVPRRAHPAATRDLVRAIAERAVERWPAGRPRSSPGPRMQAITLEVIMRVIFGVEEPAAPGAAARDPPAVARRDDRPAAAVLIAGMGPRRLESVPAFRARDGPGATRCSTRRSRRAPRGPAPRGPRRHPPRHPWRRRDEAARRCRVDDLWDPRPTLLVAGHETTATALAWALERLAAPSAPRCSCARSSRPTTRTTSTRWSRRPCACARSSRWSLRHLVAPLRDRRPGPARRRPRRAVRPPRPPPTRPSIPSPSRSARALHRASAGTDTWIPFGGGVRRCLGASFALFEMKTVLRVIARAARGCAPRAGAGARRRAGRSRSCPPTRRASSSADRVRTRARRRPCRRPAAPLVRSAVECDSPNADTGPRCRAPPRWIAPAHVVLSLRK